jgi:hypothetical protein
MKKNTGIPYELLTQTIFNEIVNQNQVETINVQQNVILQGKDSKHQIDVYWEFKHAGIKYCTVIQAKDWNSSVKQEQLFAFKTILQDLPGQPRGIFVTKKGYQKGAKEFAEKNGIELFELREFTEEDAKGRIKTINLTIKGFMPHSEILSIEHDEDWVKNFMKNNNIQGEVNIGMSGDPKYTYLLNSDYSNRITFEDLINGLYPKDYVEMPKEIKEISFSEETYIKTDSSIIPYLKIKNMKVAVQVRMIELNHKIEFDDVVAFILKNVLSQEERLIKDDLKLLR